MRLTFDRYDSFAQAWRPIFTAGFAPVHFSTKESLLDGIDNRKLSDDQQ
jgi:hypothetical protein